MWRSSASTCTFLALSSISGRVFGDTSAGDNVCGTVLASNETLRASAAYACLTSTPFKQDVAIQLLDYWKTTLSFQSNLAYLRDPPASYQQPPLDVMQGLNLIRRQVDAGVFTNQYSFEAAVQTLLQSTHDGNIDLAGSVMDVFLFGLPYTLVAASTDGHQLPQIYLLEDLLDNPHSSPVASINDELAENFLAVFASSHSFGYLEPHGDWNGLMFSWPGVINQNFGSVAASKFYPGDTFAVEFANGSKIDSSPWIAYNVQGADVPELRTGEQFYDYFVLGRLPADEGAVNTRAATPEQDEPTSGPYVDRSVEDIIIANHAAETSPEDARGWGAAYPEVADIYQPNLGAGGYVTGYFFDDVKTGVLSIPSFQLTAESQDSFSSTIGEFLQKAKDQGMEEIVIDLQGNPGGDILLATDTFDQFFPNIAPFSGMRSRSSDLADKLGQTFTSYLTQNRDSLDEDTLDYLTSSVWAVTENELDVRTKSNFTSWPDYFGPFPDHNDDFSAVYTKNLSSLLYIETADYMQFYPLSKRPSVPSYKPEDIAILTDGGCAAECDMFMEMMHYEAGVRTVVVGGLPQYGPMQARGSTRGAVTYFSSELDADIESAGIMNDTVLPLLPKRFSEATNQTQLTFNFADQIRPGVQTPLHFIYEAADCRIFWTLDTINNLTKLWKYAAEAVFRDASFCVANSAEHNNTMKTDLWGPSKEQKKTWASTNSAFVSKSNHSGTADSNLAQDAFNPNGRAVMERAMLAKVPAPSAMSVPRALFGRTGVLNEKRRAYLQPETRSLVRARQGNSKSPSFRSSVPATKQDQPCASSKSCGNANKLTCIASSISCGATKVSQGYCRAQAPKNNQCPGGKSTIICPRASAAQKSLTPQVKFSSACFCGAVTGRQEEEVCKAAGTVVQESHMGFPDEGPAKL